VIFALGAVIAMEIIAGAFEVLDPVPQPAPQPDTTTSKPRTIANTALRIRYTRIEGIVLHWLKREISQTLAHNSIIRVHRF
jgi:hypothetical protein